MRKKNLVLALFLIVNLQLFAQDYIIRSIGDTVRGTILRSTISMVKIQPVSGKSIKFSPLEIREFRQEGTLFLSREMYGKYGNEQKFIGVEIEGKVNLLSLDGSAPVMMSGGGGGMMMMSGGGRGTYYVEKKGEVTVLQDVITGAFSGEKRLKEVRAILLAVMGDDDELATRINETGYFSGKIIRKLVEDYNRKKLSLEFSFSVSTDSVIKRSL